MNGTTLINETGFIYTVVSALVENVTGNLFGAFFLIMLAVFALGIAFKVPIEYTAIFLIPLYVALAAYYQSFLALFGVLLLFVGVIAAKNYIIGRI